MGVGGDAAADAGARRRRLLLPVDGPVAHRRDPRRRHAGGETLRCTESQKEGHFSCAGKIQSLMNSLQGTAGLIICGLLLVAGGERDVGRARVLPEGSISPGGE